MNAYVNECSDKFEHVKDVVRIINQFVKDGEVEKKKFGEVMTPISLVKEMLDTLPKEVWSNPNLKWLDPANGAGTFRSWFRNEHTYILLLIHFLLKKNKPLLIADKKA